MIILIVIPCFFLSGERRKVAEKLELTREAQQRSRQPGQSYLGNLSSSNDQLTESQRRIEELEQRNKELEQKNADQAKKLSSSTNRLQGSAQKIQELEETINEQRNEHEGSQRRIKELEQRNAKLEEKLQEQGKKHEQTPGLLCYKLNSRPRGMCVVINNVNFYNKTENRKGAQFDEKGVKDLFYELSFTVCVLNDLKRDEIPKVAADFAAKDHSNFDAFVFVVMSHGGERDVIYGVDGRKTSIEDLMTEFKAPNCPTLRNKPKLFFIQTCRGQEKESSSATTGYADSCMEAFSPDSTLPRSVCPQEADFLLSFSTAPGYVAWRNQQSGSWFVQTLVDVIRKRHFHDHLLDMLTEVNRIVVERGHSAAGKPQPVQVPAPVHTLRAKLYL
ncbi:caspase-3-like isoform X2 [Oculina patagonica]